MATDIVMPKRDPHNFSVYWRVKHLDGVELLRAHFEAHLFPPHFHDDFVIAGTSSGGGRFATGGTSYLARAGHLILFNPGEPHYGNTVDGYPWDYRAIYITPARLKAYLVGTLGNESSDLPYFRMARYSDEVLSMRFIRCHTLLEENGDRMEQESHLLDLLSSIFVTCAHSRPKSPFENWFNG